MHGSKPLKTGGELSETADVLAFIIDSDVLFSIGAVI
jgi:hypothetical protein